MEQTGTTEDDAALRVDFHFDVMCPWAYQASLWAREVRRLRPLEIDWRFFSLEEINREEGKKHPWEREWSYGWGMLRVAALLRRSSMDACDRFYAAAGAALHEQGRKPHRPDVARELLCHLDLDPSLVDDAIADPTTHDDVRADHERAVGLGAFGVPTLVFPDGQSLYGPVITPAPQGEDAVVLWDWLCTARRFPHLYELKRPKTAADLRHIQASFQPYLDGRDWESRQKPAL
jgi:2-hydroxychromene-2-carboxylate isomerase